MIEPTATEEPRMNTRNRQIVAARLIEAADRLEAAFSELAGAQHDANTSRLTIDVWDTMEMGREPEQILSSLRQMAQSVRQPGSYR